MKPKITNHMRTILITNKSWLRLTVEEWEHPNIIILSKNGITFEMFKNKHGANYPKVNIKLLPKVLANPDGKLVRNNWV